MITLKKLTWSNCFSYGENNEFVLNENGLTQIVGTNGVGKSSIPLILEEVIYNKNSKGVKKADVPNRYKNDGYKIALEFTSNDDEYFVEVNRKSSLKVQLTKNGRDISSHTATNTFKTLQDIIGVDFKTFSQLVYQNTSSSLQFLTATDTNRKKFLIDLLSLDHYVKLFELFKGLSKEASLQLAGLRSSLSTVQNWLDENKLDSAEILPLVSVDIHTEEDERHLGRLTVQLENIDQYNQKISKNNNIKQALHAIDIKKALEVEAKGYIAYDSKTQELGALQAQKVSSEQTLRKIEKLGNQCHTCGQEIDAGFRESIVLEETSKIQATSNKVKELETFISEAKQNNKAWKHKSEQQEKFEKLYASVDHSLPEVPFSSQDLREQCAALRIELDKKRKEIKRLTEENQRREKNNYRVELISEQRDKYQKELERLGTELTEIESLATNLEILKKAFSTNGLVAYKIENLVKELEELTNTYLSELSDGRFTLEFVVANDKLNVNVTDDGKGVDISSLSSGELARVNTSTLLSIRKLMSSISKSRLNVLFLDEVINVLDETGRERLVEVLIREQNLNTYLVSHGWEHPLLSKVQVIKENNLSSLEV